MAVKHGTLADGTFSAAGQAAWDANHTIEAGTVTTTELGGDITTAGKALLDDAAASNQRTTLGLVIGTNVQAFSANLDEYAAVNPTAAGLAILDDADASAQLATLGLTATAAELNVLDGITSTVTELNYTDGVTSAIQGQIDGKQALDADLTAIAALTSAANKLPYATGAQAWALADLSATARTVLDDSTVEAMRVTLEADLLSKLFAAEISVTGATTATISRMHVCSGTTADYTVTLPAASGNTGKFLGFRMATGLTKLVTLDGNASETIDGLTTRVMWAGESAILLCDGSNWFKVAGKAIPMQCVVYLSSNQGSVVTTTDTVVAVNATEIDNTGLMASLADDRIIIKRAGTYFVGGCATFENLSANSARTHSSALKNGTAFGPLSEISTLAGAYGSALVGFEAPLVVADYLQMAGFHACGSDQTFRGAAFSSSPSQLMVSEKLTW